AIFIETLSLIIENNPRKSINTKSQKGVGETGCFPV
ncbi:unnamed protein product, partial [marine sediment metagenome]